MSDRRDFLRTVTGVALAAASRSEGVHEARERAAAPLGGSVDVWRRHFPALRQRVGRRPLVYLDSAATTHRPNQVIDAVATFYRRDNANPGRALHALARRADADYEGARATVARFINAADPLEIVWTRGTTEAINLVATSWAGSVLRPGDEIVLTASEHVSNLLPWRLAAERSGARTRFVELDDEGTPRLDHLESLLSRRTRLVAFMHVSNVLGHVNPAAAICARARSAGARVLIDAAQSIPHVPVDVQALGCDFLAFSSHKMLGPMGTGVLWARRELLEEMPPYQAGSNMAHDVGLDGPVHWSPGALKFGAGTPNVSGPVGLAAAIDFFRAIGPGAVHAHESALTRHALARLGAIEGLRLFGPRRPENRVPVFSFTLGQRSGPEIVTALDAEGIAVRGGDLASLPLLQHFGVTSAARASCYLYTTVEEIDRLADVLEALSG